MTGCAGRAEPPPSYAPGYQGPLTYRVPVVGEWKVARTHYGSKRDQAYAVDIISAEPIPPTARVNEDFPSHGKPVVADAPGVVIVAVDGVPEQQVGKVNKYDQHGNYIIIDHHNGEFSLFAHLIPGSLRVGPGARVSAGQELALCGNSGHSTMTHVHWQVMNGPDPNTARGVSPRMAPYRRNGQISTEILQANDVFEAQ